MRSLTLALVLGGLAAAPALAHHGWGSYDSGTVLLLEGPVQSVSYQFPHAEIALEADGKVWEVILAPPSRMERRGIPDGLLQTGMTVTVEGYPSKVNESELRAERITIDGQTVELR